MTLPSARESVAGIGMAPGMLVITCYLDRSRRSQDAANDVRSVITARTADHRIQIACLLKKRVLRQAAQIEPDRDRQTASSAITSRTSTIPRGHVVVERKFCIASPFLAGPLFL
jgi:hypothetical protein